MGPGTINPCFPSRAPFTPREPLHPVISLKAFCRSLEDSSIARVRMPMVPAGVEETLVAARVRTRVIRGTRGLLWRTPDRADHPMDSLAQARDCAIAEDDEEDEDRGQS